MPAFAPLIAVRAHNSVLQEGNAHHRADFRPARRRRLGAWGRLVDSV